MPLMDEPLLELDMSRHQSSPIARKRTVDYF
jgi:hypothetical protein